MPNELEQESFANMQFMQCKPAERRYDGRVVRVFTSMEGVVRVTIDEPPQTGIFIPREAFYTREELEELGGMGRNISTALSHISAVWFNAGEEFFLDPTRKPI